MSEQSSGAGEFAVHCGAFGGCESRESVVRGGVRSGRVGTGYEVGGWGE